MEVRISEKEITAGVVAYLNSRGFNLDANTVVIEYTQGRKPSGLTATLREEPEVEEVDPPKSETKLVGQAVTGDVVGEAAIAPEPVVTEQPAAAEEVVAQAALEVAADEAGVSLDPAAEPAATTSLFS